MTDEVSRRDFVISTGIGYALATLPTAAWAISTPTDKVGSAEVIIPTRDKLMPAYYARPQAAGTYPCVMVIHEIFGVHEYIKDVCRRFALAGYNAIAPYFYFREGDVTKITDMKKIISDVVAKVPQKQVMEDLDATAEWLKGQKGTNIAKIGVNGFCWGGNVAWMYAAHNPKITAGVAWYGRLTGETTPLQPQFPIDIAEKLTVPVLGLYGEKDEGIPLKDVEKMREAIEKGKSGSKIIVYPGAGHAFHADYRPSYNKKAAEEGWAEALKWFKSHGM